MTAKVYAGKVHIEVNTPVVVKLTEDNVMEWLDNCDSVEVLNRISSYAKSLAESLQLMNNNTDDWRNRA